MRWLALLLCAGLASAALAQGEAADPGAAANAGAPAAPEAVEPLAFESRVTPEQVHLGEPFIYELVVTHLPGQRYELKPPGEVGAFEVLEVARSRKDEGDRAVTTFKVKMALFELGRKALPDLVLDVYEEGRTRQFVAPGASVEGLSSLPPDVEEKGAELHDIKPPEEVPIRSWRLLYVLAGLLALAALGYGLYRWLKRPRAAAAPVEPPLPAHVRALRALDALRQEDLPGQGRGREFFFRLSEILRGYLGERYRFEALECTSSELLEALRRMHTPGLVLTELHAFAQTSDWVKFARQEPSLDDCKGCLEYAYRVVRSTTAATATPGPQGLAAHAHGPDVP